MRLSFLTLVLLLETSFAFLPLLQSSSRRSGWQLPPVALEAKTKKRKRSRVVDPDGATPEPPDDEPTLIDPEDIPELHYDKSVHPVPHQPWRRGTTEGCEDPIEAEWRQQAESIIKKAAVMVGGRVEDVTWYLTQVVITVDDERLDEVEEYSFGPEIVVQQEDDGPEYIDPEEPNPEPIWHDEEDFLYERDVEMEAEFKKGMYAPKDPDDDEEDDMPPESGVSLRAETETREDMAAMSEEEEAALENEEQYVESDIFELDTKALSTMARAILEALEQVEDDLMILERHEVILTSPGAPDILETQKQFDAHRGDNVIVETQDPFNSNRVLKGKLLDRNSMDVIINKKGRMVTIPLSFVKCVKLPPVNGAPRDEEFEL